MEWSQIWETLFGDRTRARSFKIGKEFENFAERFFPPSRFDLLHRTADYRTNRARFVESSLKPDFMFRNRSTRKHFYVECKFRGSLVDGKVVCCQSAAQLARYQAYHRHTPVYLLIGLGGRPSKPAYLFLIPLNALKETEMSPQEISRYRIKLKHPIKAMVTQRL